MEYVWNMTVQVPSMNMHFTIKSFEKKISKQNLLNLKIKNQEKNYSPQ